MIAQAVIQSRSFTVDLTSVSVKHTNDLEQSITTILKTMRRAKLQDHSVYASLQEFEQELGKVRQSRFDGDNKDYQGF